MWFSTYITGIIFFLVDWKRAFDRSCCSSDGLNDENEEEQLLDPYGNPAYKPPVYPDQYQPNPSAKEMVGNKLEPLGDELDSNGFI